MRPRLRTLAALLALLALPLSAAGGAWAAVCDGAMTLVAAHHQHGDAHHGPPSPGDPPRSPDRDLPACPLMAPGAGPCTLAFVGAAPGSRPAPGDGELHDFPPPRDAGATPDPAPPFRPPEA
ncbi:MAG TPA: hypothetical protein VHG51_16685 [Longimicrobiaceae bacterium]|nr:hypothetical protein [Longimicrobiaceae bacterium]